MTPTMEILQGGMACACKSWRMPICCVWSDFLQWCVFPKDLQVCYNMQPCWEPFPMVCALLLSICIPMVSVDIPQTEDYVLLPNATHSKNLCVSLPIFPLKILWYVICSSMERNKFFSFNAYVLSPLTMVWLAMENARYPALGNPPNGCMLLIVVSYGKFSRKCVRVESLPLFPMVLCFNEDSPINWQNP